MARSASEFELDPAVVPILNGDATVSMDEWLAALSSDESVSMGVSGAELIAESRTESE
jgi:hypothetical protein